MLEILCSQQCDGHECPSSLTNQLVFADTDGINNTHRSPCIFSLAVLANYAAQLPIYEKTRPPFPSFPNKNDVIQANISVESSTQYIGSPSRLKKDKFLTTK